MATWKKESITADDGSKVEAMSPIIVSASRSTDIPAFYADWFFYRLMKSGYSAWTNPFNQKLSYVSYKDTRFIVFWSKNPGNLIDYLPCLKERNIGFYLQYSLNDYRKEHLEAGLPSLESRIDTFRRIADLYDANHVIWRFDPLILSDSLTMDELLERVKFIGDRLKGYTHKLVFSFADILSYRRVQSNLDKFGFRYRDWTVEEMLEFGKSLAELNRSWNFELVTCGEEVDLSGFGVKKNRCVDDRLMAKIAHDDRTLMDFLKVRIVDRNPSGAGSRIGRVDSDRRRHENLHFGGQGSLDFGGQGSLDFGGQGSLDFGGKESLDFMAQENSDFGGNSVAGYGAQGSLFETDDGVQGDLFAVSDGAGGVSDASSVLSVTQSGSAALRDDVIDLGNGKIAIFDHDNRDKGQRKFCGCIVSKDIGEYNTCIHQCRYCYANDSIETAKRNFQRHRTNPYGQTITGNGNQA